MGKYSTEHKLFSECSLITVDGINRQRSNDTAVVVGMAPDFKGFSSMPVPSTEQIAAMTPNEFAKLTGQSGAFRSASRSFWQRAATSSASLNCALDKLAVDVTDWLGKSRPNPKLTESVRLICLNLYVAYRQDDRLCIALPMKPAWYSAKAPRNPALSYRLTIQQAWRALEAMGYAERIRWGSPWGASYSLVRAKAGLVSRLESEGPGVPSTALLMASAFDPLVLKGPRIGLDGQYRRDPGHEGDQGDPGERPMLFADTPETDRMRSNLVRINAVNTPDRIRLPPLSDDELDDLFDALWGPVEESWRPMSPMAVEGWFTQTQLHRSFSRGSFEFGGRFYGPAWQQLPKAWRSRILIDGEPVVELDFGSLHPRLLHHRYLGIEAPEDCYAGVAIPRDLAKRAVAMMLNAENGVTRAPRWFHRADAGMTWKAMREAVASGLPSLIPYFGTGIGLKLQRLDSDMAEAVMLHFANEGVPCLTVHDSFIVAERHSTELEATMREAYRSRTGFDPIIKAG